MTKKGNKEINIYWEGSMFSGNMLVYVDTLPQKKKSNILSLVRAYSKILGYKVNTQKSIVFLYTNKLEFKI